MKPYGWLLITAALSGCSTILTVEAGLEQDGDYLCGHGETIPRVYSGTHNSIATLWAQPAYLTPLILCDTVLSLIGDTLFLGVTIPTQISRGNLCVRENHGRDVKNQEQIRRVNNANSAATF